MPREDKTHNDRVASRNSADLNTAELESYTLHGHVSIGRGHICLHHIDCTVPDIKINMMRKQGLWYTVPTFGDTEANLAPPTVNNAIVPDEYDVHNGNNLNVIVMAQAEPEGVRFDEENVVPPILPIQRSTGPSKPSPTDEEPVELSDDSSDDEILKSVQFDIPTPKTPTPKKLIRPKGTAAEQILWHVRTRHIGLEKLRRTALCTTGMPLFEGKPPEHACRPCTLGKMKKAPAGKSEPPPKGPIMRLLADYGFVHGKKEMLELIGKLSRSNPEMNIALPNKIIESRCGYVCYLLIVDAFSHRAWIFLTKNKNPPTDLITSFLLNNRIQDGKQRYLRTDQGGELAKSNEFRQAVYLGGYILEETGSDAPSENGMIERLNGTLGGMVRNMLYSAGLNATFWGTLFSMQFTCTTTLTTRLST